MATGVPHEICFETGDRPSETMAGLLVSVAQKAAEIGMIETLSTGLDLKRKQVVYTHAQKIATLVASITVGCQHIAEIQSKLVPDRVAASLFGMARFPDQSQISAFLRACGPGQVAHLAQAHGQLLAAQSRAGEPTHWLPLPHGTRLLPVDLDQTAIVTRSPRATGTAKGHVGRKRGQTGYKKSLALLGAGVQEVLWLRLDPANVHGQDAVPAVLAKIAALSTARTIPPAAVLVRADSQYGSVGTLRQLQAAGHHYLLKGYTPRSAQAMAETLPPTAVWQCRGQDSNGSTVWICEAGEQEVRGHDDPAALAPVRTRVVLLVRVAWRTRTKHGKGAPGTVREKHISFEHYLSDLPATLLDAGQLIELYNGRETEESFFRAEQDAFGAQYLRTYQHHGEAVFLWLVASTANLLRWLQHSTFAATPLEQIGLSQLVRHAMRIPATVIREAERWIVILPQTARLVRCLVHAWLLQSYQLPLQLRYDSHSP